MGLTQYAIATKERSIVCGEHNMICGVSRRMDNAHLGTIHGKLLAIRQGLHFDVTRYLWADIGVIGPLEFIHLTICIDERFNGKNNRQETDTNRVAQITQSSVIPYTRDEPNLILFNAFHI